MEGKVRMQPKTVSNTEEVVAMKSAPVMGKMDFCSAVLPCCSQTIPTSSPTAACQRVGECWGKRGGGGECGGGCVSVVGAWEV
jgi:hypothetical protein